jgi:hypothetical protein
MSPDPKEDLEHLIERGKQRMREQGYPEWHIEKWATNYRHQVSQ